MTREQFAEEFDRLCKGHKHVAQHQQAHAYYERVKHADARDWRESVTDLLCAPRFPSGLSVILDAIERRADQRRRAEIALHNRAAERFSKRLTQPAAKDPREQEYTAMRINLIRGLTTQSESGKGGLGTCSNAQRHYEVLSEWLRDPVHAEWAETESISGCGFHAGPHTLHACLTDEIRY